MTQKLPDRMADWTTRCATLLAGNRMTSDGYRYTRPAPDVYEHQWLWDSCFHALTYRWFDADMAADELLSLVQHQVKDGDDAGMIPHMAYWRGGGAALWGTDAHSIITQPPLIGVAGLAVYQSTGNADLLAALYPALDAYHAWFVRRRDPDGDHLVTLIHPWESGWDASPRWDAAMGLDAPTDDESKAARHALVGRLQDYNCNAAALEADGSFAVEAVDFNAIRAADLQALAMIAATLGRDDDAQRHQHAADAVRAAVRQKMWRDGRGVDLFGPDETPGPEPSAAPFVMLFGECLPPEDVVTLVDTLETDAFFPAYPVPTTPTDAPNFDGGHYWRGNVWLAVNWLIYTGLRRNGHTDLATQIAERSLALVDRNGFHEYFNPVTGEGLGPAQQSWSTIVLDMLGTELNA